MTFAEQIKGTVSGFVPEDKREEFEQSMGPILEGLNKTFEKYDTDIKTFKQKLQESAKKSGDAPAGVDPREYEELQRKFEERDRAFEELNTKYGETTRKHSMTEKQAKEYAEKLTREATAYSELVKESELRRAMNKLSLVEGAGDEVYDLLSKNVSVTVNDKGERKVSASIKGEDGKPMSVSVDDYIREWAEKSPLAKRVLAAPRSSGGGAQGGAGSLGGPATLEMQYADAIKRGDVMAAMVLKGKMAAELTS